MNNTIPALLISGILILTSQFSQAGSATWSANPISGDWNTAANWTPMTVPNGSTDVATFNSSAITDVTFRVDTTVASLVFNPGANSYTFSPSAPSVLTVVGTGIENNSGVIQKFISTPGVGAVNFAGNATAGSLTDFTGPMSFDDNASAGNGNFTFFGLSFFLGDSTAGAATIVVARGEFF